MTAKLEKHVAFLNEMTENKKEEEVGFTIVFDIEDYDILFRMIFADYVYHEFDISKETLYIQSKNYEALRDIIIDIDARLTNIKIL